MRCLVSILLLLSLISSASANPYLYYWVFSKVRQGVGDPIVGQQISEMTENCGISLTKNETRQLLDIVRKSEYGVEVSAEVAGLLAAAVARSNLATALGSAAIGIFVEKLSAEVLDLIRRDLETRLQ